MENNLVGRRVKIKDITYVIVALQYTIDYLSTSKREIYPSGIVALPESVKGKIEYFDFREVNFL